MPSGGVLPLQILFQAASSFRSREQGMRQCGLDELLLGWRGIALNNAPARCPRVTLGAFASPIDSLNSLNIINHVVTSIAGGVARQSELLLNSTSIS